MLRDWMTPNPTTVDAQTLVGQCREVLAEGVFRHLPVVEEGWLIGVLDAIEIEAADDNATAGELMMRSVPTAPIEAEPREVLEMLSGTANDVVVLTEAGRPIGLFSEHDAVRRGAKVLPADLPLDRYVSRELLTIEASETALVARERFGAELQRHLVVVFKGELYAVLSWRDVVHAPAKRLVSECVRPIQWRVGWSTSLKEAAGTMARHHIGLLPIVDEANHAEAVVSRSDIIVALLEHL